ncbi:MAG: heme o synthase [Alphaproteobacteria bacterium]
MSLAIRDISSVFKLRIGVAIALSALAGLAVTPGTAPSAWRIVVLVLAVFVSAASAGAYNQFTERDLDARMKRTRTRPFVNGALRADGRWLAAIGLLLAVSVVAAALATNLFAALYVFLGAFTYGVVYTVWLKRRTWLNIVVGGLAGSFAVLAGAAAVNPDLAPAPLLLAIVMFLWTPPHFWSLATALRDEYEAADVPMLPVVMGDVVAARVILAHTVALVALSLVPVAFGLGWLYLGAVAIGGAWFLWKSIALLRDPGPKAAMANFHASLGQLGLLLVGAIADSWLGI